MKCFILFFMIVALLMGGQLNAQSIIFSTFGSGDTYQLGGYSIGDPNCIVGNEFTVGVTSSYYLDKIELAVGMHRGSNELDVWLMSDAGRYPSTIIETFHFNGAMGVFGYNNPLLIAHSILHPVLNAGTDYWLVLSVPTGDFAGWNCSLGTSGLINAKQGAGSWHPVGGYGLLGAFRVSGSSTLIPEPSTVFLLSVGLLGLVGYSWQRKQKI
jgi:hypothetical protein